MDGSHKNQNQGKTIKLFIHLKHSIHLQLSSDKWEGWKRIYLEEKIELKTHMTPSMLWNYYQKNKKHTPFKWHKYQFFNHYT